MRYFLDTEFIERGHEHPLELISIGLVSEAGDVYYAVASDGWNRTHANDWVKENVLPLLDGAPQATRATRAQIRRNIEIFLSGDPEPEFWAYYADYDWVLFCQLWGAMFELPERFPRYCRDLKQLADAYGEKALPQMPGLVEHNALSDALEVRHRFLWLQAIHGGTNAV